MELLGNIPLHKTVRRVLHQQPEEVQPHIRGKRLENFTRLLALHELIIQHHLIYVKLSGLIFNRCARAQPGHCTSSHAGKVSLFRVIGLGSYAM